MLVLRQTSSEGGGLRTINLTWRLLGRSPAPPPGYEDTQLSMKHLQKTCLHPQRPKNEEWDKRQRRALSLAKPIKNSWEITIESGQ